MIPFKKEIESEIKELETSKELSSSEKDKLEKLYDNLYHIEITKSKRKEKSE